MTSNRFSAEVQEAIDRLQTSGQLFLVEQEPYPAPHPVFILLAGERYSISYNAFAFLVTHQIIQSIGSTMVDGFPAEAYIISPDFHA